MRLRRTVALAATMMFGFGIFLAVPAPVSADADPCTKPAEQRTAQELAACSLQQSAAQAKLGEKKTLEEVIGSIIYTGLSLIGIVFLGLMLYSGIRWMTAQGDSKHIEKARETIKAAIMGIVVVGLAFAITKFVLEVFVE
ncbi:MAG: pilin [bacterium]|nr:pilin [bacterium]